MRMRFVSVLALVLVLSFAVVGAGSAQTVVRYAFWGNPSVLGVEEDIIKAFEAENPDIKIEPIATPYGDHHTKLLTMVAGGDAPDVMRVDSYFFQDFVERNVLLNLDPLAEGPDGIDVKEYYPIAVADSIYEGRLYGLPWGSAPYYVFYNKDMLSSAGLEFPSTSWTQEDLLLYGQKLTKGSGMNKTYGVQADFGYVGILPWIWNNGGRLFNDERNEFRLHEKAAAEAIQWQADLIHKYEIAPSTVDMQGFTANDWFLTNRIGFVYGMADSALYLRQGDVDFDVTIHPAGKAGQWTVWKANTVGISATTQVREAAWRFLKFLLEPGGKGEAMYTGSQRVPPNTPLAEMWDLYADPSMPPASLNEITNVIGDGHAKELPLRKGWNDIERKVVEYLQIIQLGEMTALEALQMAKPEVDAIIRRLDR